MMQKWILTAFFLLPGIANTAIAQTSYAERVQEYVAKHRDLAIEEQRRSGIPAAIKLGQGILETAAGDSRLCAGANNHFGIKCKKDWQGETFAHTDDAPDECFRKYPDVKESYTDHSDFLRNSKRYAPLFTLDVTDYKGWANGLKRCGYATNPRYAQQLIKVIEEYKLHEYTNLALKAAEQPVYASLEVVPEFDKPAPDTPNTVAPATTVNTGVSATQVNTSTTPAKANSTKGVQTVNGLKAFYARKGDVLLDAAIKHNIHYPKLLEMNDLPDAPLEADMFIYLEKKNTRGKHQRYIVQSGETLLQIAQAEGIQLKSLRAYNNLEPGEEPQPGVVLYLQEQSSGKPPVRLVTNKPKSPVQASLTKSSEPAEYIEVKREEIAPKSTGNTAKPQVTEASKQSFTKTVNTQPNLATTKAATQSKVQTTTVAAPTSADDTETPITVVTKTVNIAAEPAIEEVMEQEASAAPEVNTTSAVPAAAEPIDELDRIKAKMDRVVYGSGQVSKSGIVVSEEAVPKTVTAASKLPPATSPEAAPDKFHTVQKGETAFGISKKYNITMKQLREWNNLEFEAVKIGQKLRVKP